MSEQTFSPQETANHLDDMLSQLYRLNVQTQTCRWRGDKEYFAPYFAMLDEMSLEHSAAISEVARCIDNLGVLPSDSWSDFEEKASIQEIMGASQPQDMLHNLIEAHKSLAKSSEKLLLNVDIQNDALANLATNRFVSAEKSLMELRKLLKDTRVSAKIEVS